jgi:two-component system cell cycle sensor histidine kinase/response regulator CckA
MLLIHDLRNLLNVTAARVDAMRALEDQDPRLRSHLRELAHYLDSMFELVDELLPPVDAAAAPALPPQRLDVDLVVADRAAMFRAAIGKNVALVIEPSAGGAIVMARPIDLERVLLNLLLNASEAMPRGGIVTLRTAVFEAGACLADGTDVPSRTVRVTVGDTGSGIPRFSQRFDQSDARAERRSLGLASVRLTVLRLGGRFHIGRQEPVGTLVHIDLPAAC